MQALRLLNMAQLRKALEQLKRNMPLGYQELVKQIKAAK